MADSVISNHNDGKSWMASRILITALLFSDIMMIAPPSAYAYAYDDQVDLAGGTQSSQIVLARGGGRSGGRMGGRARSASSSSSRVGRTRVSVRNSGPVIVAPGPFGFTPFGPFGYGFGFGGGIGDTVRDYRQDDELARERAELESARLKNAELEQRILQLEGASKAATARPPPPLQQIQP